MADHRSYMLHIYLKPCETMQKYDYTVCILAKHYSYSYMFNSHGNPAHFCKLHTSSYYTICIILLPTTYLVLLYI